MNERIKELAKQATRIEKSDGLFSREVFDREQFAKLIVLECISKCEEVAADADEMTQSKFVTDVGRMLHEGMWGGAKNCSEQIKEHFGVEE